MLRKVFNHLVASLIEERKRRSYLAIRNKYKDSTMVPIARYLENLTLAESIKTIRGDVVECGVWRGGMMAGLATILGGGRTYFLFDSFEGLPDAKKIDGQAALDYQRNIAAANYLDNCKADIMHAEAVMKTTGQSFRLIKGWFENTIPEFKSEIPIALLRLDGDWYESTMICLDNLFDKVISGGIIIIDDYYTWEGCTLAVHDFLSKRALPLRIRCTKSGVCYIVIE